MSLSDQLKVRSFSREEEEDMMKNAKGYKKTMTSPQEFSYEGHRFTSLCDVYHKGSDERPSDFVPSLPVLENTRVMEMGCGNGCMVASYYLRHPHNVQHALALDINPIAVENTKLNFQRYNVPGEARESNLFSGVSQEDALFDLIFWNPPWSTTSWDIGNKKLELAICDPGYKCIDLFIKEVNSYLSPRGRAFICMGLEFTDIDLLNELATRSGFKLTLTAKGTIPGVIETLEKKVTWMLLEIQKIEKTSA